MTCMSRRSFAALGASALSMGLAAVSAQHARKAQLTRFDNLEYFPTLCNPHTFG